MLSTTDARQAEKSFIISSKYMSTLTNMEQTNFHTGYITTQI
jgi:hypothetical protein